MTLTKEWLQHQIAEFESCAERTDGYHLDEGGKNTLAALKLALEGMEAEPVAWIVGGIATNDKKWAVRRSEEDNLLMEPLYMHPIITGIDENHYDPELEPGLYVAEIMTKGGAAIINGYYTTPQPLTTPERAELENYRNAQQVVPGEKVIGTFDAEKNELALLDKNMTVEKFAHWHVHNSLEVIVRPVRAAMLQGVDYR